MSETRVDELDRMVVDPPCPFKGRNRLRAWWRGYHQRCWYVDPGEPLQSRGSAFCPYTQDYRRKAWQDGWDAACTTIDTAKGAAV